MYRIFTVWIVLMMAYNYCSGQYTGFRKHYKAGTIGCQFMASAPVDNGLLVAAYALDSTDSLHTGVKLVRIDRAGQVKATAFYNFDTSYWVGILSKSLTKISENRFAFVGFGLRSGYAWRYYTGVCDSNGSLIRYALKKVDLCTIDSFGAPRGIVYDNKGNLLIYGNIQCAPKSRMLLIKMDTLLNVLWEKDYSPNIQWYTICRSLIPDSSGYTLFGGTQFGSSSSPSYQSRSVLIRVDTGGMQQWIYESPIGEINSEVHDAVATPDGGYAYLANGPAVNLYDPQLPVTAWAGKGAVVKLDANRQIQWRAQYGNWYVGITYPWAKNIFVTTGGNLIVAGQEGDSIGVNQWNSFLRFRKYDAFGQLLWQRNFPSDDIPDTLEQTTGFEDGEQLSDGSLMMVGLQSVIVKRQLTSDDYYGFVMRTDSNGCVNPNGPECWPLAVPELPHPSSAVSYTLYPNPATDIAVLSRSVQEQIAEVRFTDVSGRAVAAYKMPAGVSSIELDVSQWPRGVYLYHIYAGNQLLHSGRLVK